MPASEPVMGLLAVFYGIVRFVIIFRRRVILSQAWVFLFMRIIRTRQRVDHENVAETSIPDKFGMHLRSLN
jgi:hypothetical protein